jgi:hypothetical protein
MTPEQLRAKRVELRELTTAPRSETELHGLPSDAYITPIDAALLMRMSVEALMANRQRGLPPRGFRVGRVVRFTMGEIRAAAEILRKKQEIA